VTDFSLILQLFYYAKTYVLTNHIGKQLHSNDYYNDFTHLNPNRKLTCVIGAQGADGCTIISDTRETIGSEYRDLSKVRILWNNKAAMACAGDAPLIDNIAEGLSRMSKNVDYHKMIEDIKMNVQTALNDYQSTTIGNPFKAIFMGLKEFDKGDPYIRLIDPRGFSTPIEYFEIIGRGNPYVIALFKLFYDRRLKVNELAVLGYFCIATLISLELDNSVGTGQLGPEAVVLKTNEEPTILNRDYLDPDFKTARASSKSLKFRNRLMKSIWNRVPEAFKGGQQFAMTSS
jgi:20S proteasome alpha/beta subunit